MEKTAFNVQIQRWVLNKEENLQKIEHDSGGVDDEYLDIIVLV